jgi:hypothetical protein
VTLLQAKAIDKMWEDASLSGGPYNHFGAKNWYGLMPTILSPSGGIGPTVGTGATNPERIYDWDHRDLTGNVQNLYSTRVLAAANPFGEPSPTAMEDELQLNESPLSPSQTTNGATTSTGSYFQNNDYEGIVDRISVASMSRSFTGAVRTIQMCGSLPRSASTAPLQRHWATATRIMLDYRLGTVITMRQASAIAAATSVPVPL